MGGRFHRAGLRPGEQFMGGNSTFPDLQMLLAVVRYLLSKLLSMSQKKVEVEGARFVKHLLRSSEGGSFLGIGSSLDTAAQIQAQHRQPPAAAP